MVVFWKDHKGYKWKAPIQVAFRSNQIFTLANDYPLQCSIKTPAFSLNTQFYFDINQL